MGVGAVSQGTRFNNRLETAAFAHPFAGQIPEVLVYNTAHTEVRELAYAYLNEKYNLNLGLQPLQKSNVDDEWVIQTEETIVSENSGLEIYPNPAYDNATIMFGGDRTLAIRLAITDLLGTPIITEKEVNTFGSNAVNVDTKQLPAGVYMVKVENGTSTFSKQLVIVR